MPSPCYRAYRAYALHLMVRNVQPASRLSTEHKEGPTMANDLSSETVKQYYDQLRALPEGGQLDGPDDVIPNIIPQRWTDADWNTAAEFARKVAKGTTLEEFDQFLRNGELTVPIKMSPAEMEVLMGGSVKEWIGAAGAIGVAAAASACGEL